jgi:hypothetical protein
MKAEPNIFLINSLSVNTLKIGNKLSPKILIVILNARLSLNTTTDEQKFGRYLKVQLESIKSDSILENEMKTYM